MQHSIVVSTGPKVKSLRSIEVLRMLNSKPAKALPWRRWIAWGILAPPFAFPALVPAQVHLLPAPREAHFQGETALPARIAVSVPGHDAEDAFAARDLEEAVRESA